MPEPPSQLTDIGFKGWQKLVHSSELIDSYSGTTRLLFIPPQGR